MKIWLKEPLLHFLFAGALLFAAYGWLNRDKGDDATGERVVRITAAQVEWLKESWARQWQRPPSEEELKGLVAAYLKEELLAREAQELGLEENDTIVRRRLAQKLEFLVQDTARLAEPTEEDLRQFYEAHLERFQTPAHVTFSHVFFNRDHPGGAVTAATQVRQQLANLDASVDVAALGDRFLLEYEFVNSDEQAIGNLFGQEFARQVFMLEPGQWRGPIKSSYGLHLVRVHQRQVSKVLDFAEARDKVMEEWQRRQQQTANERFFAALLQKYDVIVDEDVKSLVGPLKRGEEARR